MGSSLKHLLHGTLIVSAFSAYNSSASVATPITQKLERPSSSIKFGVDSPAPALQMNGQLQTFSGTITLNGDGSAISDLAMTVQLDSAQLPPDQMLQNIFLHSVIARLHQNVATFRSSTIERFNGDEYRATGSYTWHHKTRSATLPFRLVRSSPTHSELRILMRGALTDTTTPKELASAAPGASQSSGWARATLIFAPQKVS